MLSIKGIYDGKQLKLAEKIKISSPKKVIITFLDAVEDELAVRNFTCLPGKAVLLIF